VQGNDKANSNHEPVIDPALEKPLLNLHRAMDVDSFWRAVQQVLSAAVPSHVIGLSFHRNPVLPRVARCTRPMPDKFFAVEPLSDYAARPPRKKSVRLSDFFPDRSGLVRSVFYRRYMAAQNCQYYVSLFFWERQRPICAIAILRTAKQGDFSNTEIKLLGKLYPQFLAALRRIESLERERFVRADFEEFLRQLPLPTMILRWNLKPIYQNRAAREFCAVWEKGPEEAKRTNATSPIPSEILDRCRALKEQWTNEQPRKRSGPLTNLKTEQVRHPQLPNLRATIQLKQIKSASVARPHFFIACEDLCRNGERSGRLGFFRLPAFGRLTRREREVARLACEGRSNKEIAQNACLSLPTVKKHLHSVFRKLEVPSRSRLVAMML